MDPISALALLDALLTGVDNVARIISEHQKTGAITVEEQQQRLDRIAELNSKYGV